jgi:hypothetical protein
MPDQELTKLPPASNALGRYKLTNNQPKKSVKATYVEITNRERKGRQVNIA